MFFFPWISPEAQAKKLTELFANAQASFAFDDLKASIASVGSKIGARLLVMPKLRSLCDYSWSFGDGPAELPHEARALDWFIRTLKKADFPIEDNLADAGLGMDHSEKFVRTISQTREGYAAWEKKQPPGHFLILPVFVGWSEDTGKSPFEARMNSLANQMFPLDPIAVLSMLYTHHEELGDKVVWIDAVGGEVSPKGDGRYDDTPYFDRRGRGLVNLDWNWGRRKRSFRIAPSARLPR